VFKKIITWLGVIVAAVCAFILGRSFNRGGVSRADGIADDIGNGLDRAGENNRDLTNGISRVKERTDSIGELVNDADGDNKNAVGAIRRAKEILNNAKARN
jgi:hypothetical protein